MGGGIGLGKNCAVRHAGDVDPARIRVIAVHGVLDHESQKSLIVDPGGRGVAAAVTGIPDLGADGAAGRARRKDDGEACAHGGGCKTAVAGELLGRATAAVKRDDERRIGDALGRRAKIAAAIRKLDVRKLGGMGRQRRQKGQKANDQGAHGRVLRLKDAR